MHGKGDLPLAAEGLARQQAGPGGERQGRGRGDRAELEHREQAGRAGGRLTGPERWGLRRRCAVMTPGRPSPERWRRGSRGGGCGSASNGWSVEHALIRHSGCPVVPAASLVRIVVQDPTLALSPSRGMRDTERGVQAVRRNRRRTVVSRGRSWLECRQATAARSRVSAVFETQLGGGFARGRDCVTQPLAVTTRAGAVGGARRPGRPSVCQAVRAPTSAMAPSANTWASVGYSHPSVADWIRPAHVMTMQGNQASGEPDSPQRS